jgi:hypothetical protein
MISFIIPQTFKKYFKSEQFINKIDFIKIKLSDFSEINLQLQIEKIIQKKENIRSSMLISDIFIC